MLAGALESVLAQDAGGVRYEFIIVDNNSPDRTREVVESFIARGHGYMRYVFESKQGLSHARNAGIAQARAPIIVFTDDDVRVARDWVSSIKRTFDEHPEVSYVGGKVLPLWEGAPPAWLTGEHWAPLALTDHGDKAFYVNAAKPWCLVGANLSVRRAVFDQIGLFTPKFQRVKDHIGSTEDHEFQLRLWRTGSQGLYAPEVVVSAEVQANRLEKIYHRRWHTGHGRYCAMMEFEEVMQADGSVGDVSQDMRTLFGVAGYTYRDLLTHGKSWIAAALRGQESKALFHENRIRYFKSYIRQRYEEKSAEPNHSALAEVVAFAKSVKRRLLSSKTI